MTFTVGGDLLLEQVTAGDAEPVLVMDFAPFSAAPRLGELLAAKAAGRPVYQVDPLSALSGDLTYAPLSDLAGLYTEAFIASVPPDGHVFVVSHCGAAAVSLHVTSLLAVSRKVTAILLEPTWPDDEEIRSLFGEFQANLGAGRRPCPALDGDPADCVGQMVEILRQEMSAVAASRGLGGSAGVFGELLARYRAWLAFLLACQHDVPTPPAATSAAVRVLTSTSATIPGLSADSYEIVAIPVRREAGVATQDLADLALTQITAR